MSGQIQFDPPQPSDLSAMLPGYEIHDLIATGGMGAVYRATHISLDRAVAIKVLPAEFADASFHEQFQAEARAMAKLNHPNLIAIYDFGQAQGLPFIVMEFVAGKSLYYSAYKKAIEESTAVRLVTEICDGLAQAHQNNIIHRDIKPANILLDPDAKAKIGDFGLAAQSDLGPQHSSDDVVFGTPGYAAPEIIHNPAAIGKPSDIFAVGVILYELLTGHLPDPSSPKPASRIANCDPRLDRVIRKATHSNPAMRYQDAGEMHADLIKITNSSPPRPAARQLQTPQSGNNPRKTSRLVKRSGPVPVSRAIKAQQVSPDNTTPILAKPKKITGKVPARTSDDYDENKDLSQERPVKRPEQPKKRARRPKTYTGPTVNDPAAVPHPHTQARPAPNTSLLRNCVIIAILVPALILLVQKYREKQIRIKKEEQRLEAEAKARRELEKSRLPLPPDRTSQQKPGTKPGKQTLVSERQTTLKPAVLISNDPLDQLSELRNSLARGSRDPMPDTVLERGTKFIMVIETKMTWSEACRFAEDHGAYLATPVDSSDIAWLNENFPKGTQQMWIGGGAQGHSEWAWVDGRRWIHRKPPTDLGACAMLTSLGTIKARPNDTELPFFIQWEKDGTNPGSIGAQLERLKGTLNGPSPAWPPGTLSFDSRHYFLVQQSLDWEEADLVASSGGGHLAVFSDRNEATFLTEVMRSLLLPDETVWLGGLRRDKIWRWSTGEPFNLKLWRTGYPRGDDDGLRFRRTTQQSGWENANPFDSREVDGFLIEWSNDRVSVKKEAQNGDAGEKELERLQQLGRKLVLKEVRSHAKLIRENLKNLHWDIDRWYDQLTKNRKAKFLARIESYRKRLSNQERIPSDIDKNGMPARIKQLYESSLDRQQRFDNGMEKKLSDLRNGYLTKLLDAQEKARTAGDRELVSALAKEITAIGQTTRSFRQHFR